MVKGKSIMQTKPKTKVKKAISGDSDKEAETVVAVTPEICIDHDDKTYYVEIELPGVRKEHVDLSVSEQSLCIQAARSDEAIVYLGCFGLAHMVDQDKAKAKFASGLLSIEIPLKTPIKGKRITIE